MIHRTFQWVLFLSLPLFLCACATPHKADNLSRSVQHLKTYADSFVGMNIEAVRERLAGIEIAEEEWGEGNIGGQELVATYPDYELRVLFFEEAAITVSIQVLSGEKDAEESEGEEYDESQ